MATPLEATGLALGLFPIVLEGITMYINSAEKVIEMIRHKRTLERFRRDLEVENIIYDNIWCTLGSRAGVPVEPNMKLSTTTITEVLSCLHQDARKSFVNSCEELVSILKELETKFQKYAQNLVSKNNFLAGLYH